MKSISTKAEHQTRVDHTAWPVTHLEGRQNRVAGLATTLH